MLEANKSRWFEKIFAVYNRNLFKRRFHSIQISGLDFLRNKDANIPLLIYANHSSWWDGLTAFEISRAARLDSYVMMDEANLKRYFLFRRLGAFSVSENKRRSMESIRYAVNLLKENPQRTVWIFPQGEIVPNALRPFKFYTGAARIIEKVGKCLTVPLAMRLEFTDQFKPEIFVKIAEPRLIVADTAINSKNLTELFTGEITKVLDELNDDIIFKRTNGYQKTL